MISFVNDYSENAHPDILNALIETNLEGNVAYSGDEHTERAAKLIRKKIKKEDAEIQILMGGTQTNLIAACAFLRPHEAIIADGVPCSVHSALPRRAPGPVCP